MANSIFTAPFFHDEEAAYSFIEARLWAKGRVCPHCGEIGKSSKMAGQSTRIGVYKCYGCRKPFTVKVGTIFESSHIKLHLWLQAIFLIAASKKGISSHQLHRLLGITVKSAWFMSHRIREAMRSGDLSPFGSDGGPVEVDETFIGREDDKPVRRGYGHKVKVLALVDRETGQARSMVVDDLKVETLMPIVQANVSREALLMTDEASQYKRIGKAFSLHKSVNHSEGEYVNRFQPWVHTNTIEGYFSIFKRGMKGVYQHCSKEHLHRYLAEFDFRYNNRMKLGVDDFERAEKMLSGVSGKRLTYQTTVQ